MNGNPPKKSCCYIPVRLNRYTCIIKTGEKENKTTALLELMKLINMFELS